MTILEEIIAYKKTEVEKSKDRLPLDQLQKLVRAGLKPAPTTSAFSKALKSKIDKKEIALIAEIKKASPSKGIIKEDFNHLEIAKAYEKGGATCLSVLTDEKYFQGNLKYIQEIKSVEALRAMPLLRKDFIVDPYQIYESIYNQADCILLIVRAFCIGASPDLPLLRDLYEIACENEIDVLVEIHDEREMEIALDLVRAYSNTPLLGINNRDLKTFKTNLNTTIDLVTKYKRDLNNKIVVSESGIFTNEDVRLLVKYGIYSFLVGEGLIINEDIVGATKRLINIL